MYYKLKIEEVDFDRNTIKVSEVWVTEEMLKNSHSVDVLKMSACQLIDKFRSENNLKEPHDEHNIYRYHIDNNIVNLPLED